MNDLSKRVPLLSPESYNTGLTEPTAEQMLSVFGRPGNLTVDCSAPTGKFAEKVVTQDVGPFRVTGHSAGVASLRHIFDDVKTAGRLDILEQVRSEGMLCVRKVRGGTNYSNHSFCAIDLRFGPLIELGEAVTCQGLVDLYHFMHEHDWWSGMGYERRKDSMHFSPSWQLVQKWQRLGLI